MGRCTCLVLSAVYLQGIGDVGFSKAGGDRKSGVDLRTLRSVGRRRRTSVDDVGRLTWCQTGCRCRCPRRKSAPGKCFRYGLATQDLVSQEVHGLRTAIATGNASLLIYDFDRKRGRSGDRGDGRSYIQCSWWEPVETAFP